MNWAGIATVTLMVAWICLMGWIPHKIRQWVEKPEPATTPKPEFSLAEYEAAMKPVRERWAVERHNRMMKVALKATARRQD